MASQKQISDLITAIIGTYKVNKEIKWNSCELTECLKELLKQGKYSNNIGEGFKIKFLTVKGRRFKCIHLSSSKGYFPVTKKNLLNSESPRQKSIRLMREEIDNQITEFKQEFRDSQVDLIDNGFVSIARKLARCPIKNTILTKYHVDHVIPFIQLADIWLENFTLYDKFDQVKKEDLKSWSDFHKKYAILRLVSAKGNIDRGSEGYRSIH